MWDMPQELTRHETELEVRKLEWTTFDANQRSGDTGDLRPRDNRLKYWPLNGRIASSRTGCTKASMLLYRSVAPAQDITRICATKCLKAEDNG